MDFSFWMALAVAVVLVLVYVRKTTVSSPDVGRWCLVWDHYHCCDDYRYSHFWNPFLFVFEYCYYYLAWSPPPQRDHNPPLVRSRIHHHQSMMLSEWQMSSSWSVWMTRFSKVERHPILVVHPNHCYSYLYCGPWCGTRMTLVLAVVGAR